MDESTTVTDATNTYVQVMPGCPYCGAYHEGTCPRVEEMEYYPDGALKRVRLRQEQAGPEVRLETGHECGKPFCPACS